MSRLKYGDKAFIRKLEMSRAQVFAFVEGGLDRPFIERLLLNSLSPDFHGKLQVIAAKELPGDTGGKPRIEALYKNLRVQKKLNFESFGKKAICIIFLDKDIDDLRRRKLKSSNVLYTPTYDLEGLIFTRGDLVRATADAAGLTTSQARTLLGSPGTWILSQAKNWTDWTTLCVLSETRNVNVGSSYQRPSAINPQMLGPVDAAALAAHKDALASAVGLARHDFDMLFDRYRSKVAASVSSRESLAFFKGKWLLPLLERHFGARNAVPDASGQALGQKVAALLVAQVGASLSCQCCAAFRQQIQGVASYLH